MHQSLTGAAALVSFFNAPTKSTLEKPKYCGDNRDERDAKNLPCAIWTSGVKEPPFVSNKSGWFYLNIPGQISH